ncbi:MAG TPA: hypothetical protein VEL07_09100 [Planctomycetota bacterium]|nr:hypothetical protein [Planctomycetota bacterium]
MPASRPGRRARDENSPAPDPVAQAEAAVRAAEERLAAAQADLTQAREHAQHARWHAQRAEQARRERVEAQERERREHEQRNRPTTRSERDDDRPTPSRAAAERRSAGATKPRRDGPLATRGATKRPSSRKREAALAALTALLPKRITATIGKRSRILALDAGARYRVEPLNPAKKRHRGRIGRLLTWDAAGTTGVIAWDDGERESVPLADLVKA